MNRSEVYDDYDDGRIDDNSANSGSITDQLDIAHYLRILRKYKWPITLLTALITIVSVYYAFTATPIYRATSTLLIEPQRANVVSIEELVGVDTDNQDYYQTQFELLKSRQLASRVINKLELWNHSELNPNGAATGDRAAGGSESREGTDSTVALVESGLLSGMREKLVDIGVVNETTQPASDISATAEPVGTGSSNGDADYLSPSNRSRELALGRFMSRLSVEPVRKTKLVRIRYNSADPVLAALVANTVGEEYITSYLDAKMELTSKVSEWLSTRLAALKETLDASEDRLIDFRKENGLVDVGGSVGRLNEQELLLTTAELTQARSELAGAADLYRDTQSLRGQLDLLATIPAVQADPLVQRAKIDLGQSQRELDELTNRYGERHPRVVDVNSRIASLNTALEGHVERVVGTVAKDYQLLQQRVASIEAKLSSGKQAIQAIGTKKFELDALEREVATNQSIYDTFFNRMTEARSADGLESANARVSDRAVPPVGPFKPKKQLIVALAALGSLVLSMLMAFLYEQMDDTVKSTNDVEKKLGISLLGILPLVKGGLFSRKGSNLPLNPTELSDKGGRFAEAVNTVRTAVCVSEGSTRKVIVVTSSVPGEGKSTTAINLAYSLGQLERVLLIDCDLRRPTVAKAIGEPRDALGLSNLIQQNATASQCVHRGVFNGTVDVLPSGPNTDQPLELLSSARFARILEQLGRYYDRIIIDSAPAQAVSDALVLSKMSDAVIYCIRSHDTSIELAHRGIERLRQVGAPIAGAVITQVDVDKIMSYGGDYYYQGYYDYYGYNEEGDKVRRASGVHLSQDELMQIRTDEDGVEVSLEIDVNRGQTANATRRVSRREVSSDQDVRSTGDAMRQPASADEGDTVRTRSRRFDDLDII